MDSGLGFLTEGQLGCPYLYLDSALNSGLAHYLILSVCHFM